MPDGRSAARRRLARYPKDLKHSMRDGARHVPVRVPVHVPVPYT